jgi:sugar lactone lactonase YvrE
MRMSFVVGVSVSVAALFLSGCTLQSAAPAAAGQGVVVQGRVHGGRQAIAGARIYLMAAGTSGYGAASVSLLDSRATGQADGIGAYVVSDALGGFSITNDYSCTSSQQVYLLAVGGNAGSGSNAAAALMAVLGQCPSASSNFAAAVPFILVNELTTVAGVYALSGFMTDLLHVASSGTALVNTGLANAFVTASTLANVATGAAYLTTPAGNGTAPQAKMNTLANILASCINTNGSTVATPVATNCGTLFANATSDGTAGGVVPTETVTAALNIAHNPGVKVAGLFALAAASAPFQPTASSVTDLTLAVKFTGGGTSAPSNLAVDQFGDVWIANLGYIASTPAPNNSTRVGGSVSKLAGGSGAPLSPDGTGFTGGGLYLPYAIAIDNSNNVWLSGDSTSTTFARMTKLTSDGTPVSADGYNLGFVSAGALDAMAIDSYGNVIIVPHGTIYRIAGSTGVVSQLSGTIIMPTFAMALSPDNGIWVSSAGDGVKEFDTLGRLAIDRNPYGSPYSIWGSKVMAIDHSGSIWVGNGVGVGTVLTYGVEKYSNNGTLLSPYVTYTQGGFDTQGRPGAIAIDGVGHVFIADLSNALTELNNDGSAISPASGYTDSSISVPVGIAVDGSGNVWLANYSGNSVTEFVGVGAPVVTPIAAGVANNTLGVRP